MPRRDDRLCPRLTSWLLSLWRAPACRPLPLWYRPSGATIRVLRLPLVVRVIRVGLTARRLLHLSPLCPVWVCALPACPDRPRRLVVSPAPPLSQPSIGFGWLMRVRLPGTCARTGPPPVLRRRFHFTPFRRLRVSSAGLRAESQRPLIRQPRRPSTAFAPWLAPPLRGSAANGTPASASWRSAHRRLSALRARQPFHGRRTLRAGTAALQCGWRVAGPDSARAGHSHNWRLEMFAKLIIVGNLGSDPEMRYTSQG